MITKTFDILFNLLRVALVVLLVAGGITSASAQQNNIIRHNKPQTVKKTEQKSRVSRAKKKFGYSGSVTTQPRPAVPKTAAQKYEQGDTYFNSGKYSEAVNMYRQAAEQGDPRAQYKLAECYESGTGITRDLGQAMDWYEAAYNNDDKRMESEAENAIQRNEAEFAKSFDDAAEFYNTGDYDYAFIIFDELARYGYAAANNMVGECYAKGQGCRQDDSLAFNHYKRAAEGGDDDGQYHLGICYLEGNGTMRDDAKACEFFRKAADNDNTDAAYALGQCYENGIGIEADNKLAIDYYRKAAQKGDEDARSALHRLGAEL